MLYDTNNPEPSTPTDAIDYDLMEEAFYNAMDSYYNDNPISVNGVSVPSSYETPLEFASSTDSTFYTVQTVDAPTTLAEQVGAYTLDTRNILLIFLLVYLIITIYSKLKNTFLNFFGRS